jgi:hypothetical protein
MPKLSSASSPYTLKSIRGLPVSFLLVTRVVCSRSDDLLNLVKIEWGKTDDVGMPYLLEASVHAAIYL